MCDDKLWILVSQGSRMGEGFKNRNSKTNPNDTKVSK